MGEDVLSKANDVMARVGNIQMQLDKICAELEKLEPGIEHPIFKPATPENIAQRRLGVVAVTLDSIDRKLDIISKRLGAIKKAQRKK